jgi:hypothetical protein
MVDPKVLLVRAHDLLTRQADDVVPMPPPTLGEVGRRQRQFAVLDAREVDATPPYCDAEVLE